MYVFCSIRFTALLTVFCVFQFGSSYPDEEAGQIPMAYVVRKPGGHITEAQVIDFVAQQASF